MPEQFVYAQMEIDHIQPLALGGIDDEENLCYSCPRCNRFKGSQITGIDAISGVKVALYNPRSQSWLEHFSWSEDYSQIIGLTACGRVTVLALQLNIAAAVTFRRKLAALGWYPPSD